MNIDQELLLACIKGDRKSQSKLYSLSFSSLMSIAYRYQNNRDDAASLVNNCFLKILNGLPSFTNSDAQRSYFSWTKKIMMNTIIDEFRKSEKSKDLIKKVDDPEYLEQFGDEEYNLIEKDIEEEALQYMITQLSETQKNVFNLFAIDGYSHKEIAEALTLSVANSKWHLSQARRLLQGMLRIQLEKQKTIHHG